MSGAVARPGFASLGADDRAVWTAGRASARRAHESTPRSSAAPTMMMASATDMAPLDVPAGKTKGTTASSGDAFACPSSAVSTIASLTPTQALVRRSATRSSAALPRHAEMASAAIFASKALRAPRRSLACLLALRPPKPSERLPSVSAMVQRIDEKWAPTFGGGGAAAGAATAVGSASLACLPFSSLCDFAVFCADFLGVFADFFGIFHRND
mmetsp:Transcript_7064/g.22622  ORF Transcript_7064/g.22622 Transcript_7064/m.22622 type:complete len:213 (+) Transcript_7064:967-1605(+)